MPSDCDEEENRRGEGSKPNYDSPDKRSLFFFAVIAMNMPQHLNLSHQVQSDIRYDPDYPSYKLTFRVRAWSAASAKARWLGWIA